MASVSKLIGNRLFSAAFLFLRSFAFFAPSLKNDFVWDNIKVVTKINYSFSPSGIISCVIPKSLAKKKERYLDIPSAGFCILIGYLIIATGSGIHLMSIAQVAGVLLIAAYTFAAYGRQGVWRDDLSHWRNTANISPDHPLPHTNYGLRLSNAGRFDEAAREFEIALQPGMDDSPRGRAVTANNMGIVYLDRGEYPQAEAWFREARDYDPRYGSTYYHLGLICFIKGEITGSVDSYRKDEKELKKQIDYYEHYGRANLILAKVYMRMG